MSDSNSHRRFYITFRYVNLNVLPSIEQEAKPPHVAPAADFRMRACDKKAPGFSSVRFPDCKPKYKIPGKSTSSHKQFGDLILFFGNILLHREGLVDIKIHEIPVLVGDDPVAAPLHQQLNRPDAHD